MARLGIAGYKVLRWEREWLSEGQPFRDPLNYPTCSVVTSSTHDTETLADWWDEASRTDRQATMAIPFLKRVGCDPDAHFRPEIRDAIIELLFASAADLLLLPIQDVFGWRDRINTPALISEQNWTWRLSWPVEDLQAEPAARERAGFLRRLADRYHRRLT
jgi:4-alpha-glucanotransferase